MKKVLVSCLVVGRRCKRMAMAVALGLVVGGVANAQDPAADTTASITSAFTTMGFDPATFVNGFVGDIGPIIVTLLAFGGAIIVGKKLLKHFSRAT